MPTDSETPVPPPPPEPTPSSPVAAPPPPPDNPATPAGKPEGADKKIVAGILAILLGWVGVHKFYLGYQKEGIIMLVCGLAGWFLCGLPTAAASIIGIIEGIMYLTKTDEEFVATYVTGRKPWF